VKTVPGANFVNYFWVDLSHFVLSCTFFSRNFFPLLQNDSAYNNSV
jgi:hypothetical protein